MIPCFNTCKIYCVILDIHRFSHLWINLCVFIKFRLLKKGKPVQMECMNVKVHAVYCDVPGSYGTERGTWKNGRIWKARTHGKQFAHQQPCPIIMILFPSTFLIWFIKFYFVNLQRIQICNSMCIKFSRHPYHLC